MTEYKKNKDIFLRKSKKGNHLYAFTSGEVLVISIEELSELIDDNREWVKVSVMERNE